MESNIGQAPSTSGGRRTGLDVALGFHTFPRVVRKSSIRPEEQDRQRAEDREARQPCEDLHEDGRRWF